MLLFAQCPVLPFPLSMIQVGPSYFTNKRHRAESRELSRHGVLMEIISCCPPGGSNFIFLFQASCIYKGTSLKDPLACAASSAAVSTEQFGGVLLQRLSCSFKEEKISVDVLARRGRRKD